MDSIAVLSYNYDKYSETFIHNLVRYLPFHVHYLFGGELPEYYGGHQKFLKEEGFAKVIVALQEWLGKSKHQQQKDNIEKYLVSNKIKAVLANYAITAFPVMNICSRNQIPLIVHFHGWTAYRSTIIEQHRAQYNQLFHIAHAIIAVSNDMKQQLINLGADPQKIFVTACGYDEHLFHYTDHSSNQNIFVAAGRFCDTKNPHLTIMAFSKILSEVPDAKLIMIGGDETLLNVSINLAKALGISDKIEFCGVLKHAEVYDKMKIALAYVQHSATTVLNEKEGTPVSILEASASGLPVISTRHAGIMDVVIDNETGLLGDEFDIDQMAMNMIRLAKDRALAQKLGEQAAIRVASNFTMKMYIDNVTSILNQVIEKSN